ncbi:hypothetical protein Lalb_Chr25g0285451 [Lupinus albus]|uniref:Uncharacterized protein n=1 Tax=Lupinus albus TaxID=3870 RepID=A0A6A4N8C3_LUPAL|nr:hypothetical protein Lalb_Chr25g0285451 [Lupinus albus]
MLWGHDHILCWMKDQTATLILISANQNQNTIQNLSHVCDHHLIAQICRSDQFW